MVERVKMTAHLFTSSGTEVSGLTPVTESERAASGHGSSRTYVACVLQERPSSGIFSSVCSDDHFSPMAIPCLGSAAPRVSCESHSFTTEARDGSEEILVSPLTPLIFPSAPRVNSKDWPLNFSYCLRPAATSGSYAGPLLVAATFS